jgi:hypothetical protein
MSRLPCIGLALGDEPRGFHISREPFHADACGHSCGSYIGSAVFYELVCDKQPSLEGSFTKDYRKLDVYVDGDHVCIRYGAEPPHYASPGSLLDFVITAIRHPSPHYMAALRVIQRHAMVEVRAR